MAQRYGGYEYETSPRKLEPEVQPRTPKKQQPTKKDVQKKEIKKQVKQKVKTKNHVMHKQKKVVLYIGVAFAILLAISYRNSLINENFAKVKNLKNELSVVEKENQQLQVAIESSLNFNNIEQSAKDKLGMQKLSNAQKVYINLPKKDYVQPASEEVTSQQEQNILEKFWNKIVESKE